MSLSRTVSIATALMLAAGAASAQQDEHDGGYLGAGFVAGFDNFDTGSFDLDFDTGLGGGAWFGYRSGYVAGELQLDYVNFEASDFDFELESFVATGNVKFYPFAGRLEPFVLGGMGFAVVDADVAGVSAESGFVLRFGAGLDAYVTDNIALTGVFNYVVTTGDVEDTDFISIVVGPQFHF